MTDGLEYLDSDLVDVGAADLAELGSLDPNLLAASLEQVLRRARRPAEAIAGRTKSGVGPLEPKPGKPSADGI
jgi:hypothetical protein